MQAISESIGGQYASQLATKVADVTERLLEQLRERIGESFDPLKGELQQDFHESAADMTTIIVYDGRKVGWIKCQLVGNVFHVGGALTMDDPACDSHPTPSAP